MGLENIMEFVPVRLRFTTNPACSWHQRVPIPWNPPSNLAWGQVKGGSGCPAPQISKLGHGVLNFLPCPPLG